MDTSITLEQHIDGVISSVINQAIARDEGASKGGPIAPIHNTAVYVVRELETWLAGCGVEVNHVSA
jgi:hypothetical protein